VRGLNRFISKAIPTLAGIAFFVYGCQPQPYIEPTTSRGTPETAPRETLIKAEMAFQSGEYGQALAAYRQVLDKTPQHPQAPLLRYQIAYCLFQTGDYQQALNESGDWLNRYPEHPLTGQVLFLIARSHQALEDPYSAFEWLIKAAKHFDPSHIKRQEIDTAIMKTLNEADIDQLEQMAQTAMGTEFAPQIYYRITTRLLDDNKPDEAKKAAMALVQSSPEQYWVSLGRQLLERIDRELSPKEGVIGCLLPLTGPYAIYGQETLNGIQLGMGIINSEATSADMELIIRDTAGDPNRTLAALEELAAKDDLMAIIGPLASQTATAAVQRARDLDLPIILLTQKEGLAGEGSMIFRNFLTPRKEIAELVDQAVDGMGLKRFGILYPDNPYGRYYMNLFWDRVNEKGGVINAVESYNPDETDFGDQIKKMVGLYYPRPESIARLLEEIKKEKASLAETPMKGVEENQVKKNEEPEPFIDFEAVFIPDNHNQVALIAPQFPFYRVFNIQLLGTSLWLSQELVDNAEDYVQGAIFPSGFYKDNDSEPVRQFVEAYRAGFDSEPGLLAANGYDTMAVLKKIFENNKIRNRRDVQISLDHIEGVTGVTGMISFDEQGEVEKIPRLLTIVGHHIVTVKPMKNEE